MEHIPESRPVSPTAFSVDSMSLSNASVHDPQDHNDIQDRDNLQELQSSLNDLRTSPSP